MEHETRRKDTRKNPVGRRNGDLLRLEMMWNIIDWDTSLAKATLDIAGQGAYRNILDKLYICGGKLLNQEHVLFHASGCRDEDQWRSICQEVMHFFVLSDDEKFVTHHRVLEQIDKVKQISKIRSQAGRLGGKVKHAKHLEAKTEAGNCLSKSLANPPTFAEAKPKPITITTTITNKDQKQKNGTRFQKPTLEEVTAYCRERNNQVDPQHFMNRYESNGWMVGKTPMRNWRATVRYWEGNNHGNGKQIEPLSKTQQRIERNREAILLGLGFKEETRADAGSGGQDDKLRTTPGGNRVMENRALGAAGGED